MRFKSEINEQRHIQCCFTKEENSSFYSQTKEITGYLLAIVAAIEIPEVAKVTKKTT